MGSLLTKVLTENLLVQGLAALDKVHLGGLVKAMLKFIFDHDGELDSLINLVVVGDKLDCFVGFGFEFVNNEVFDLFNVIVALQVKNGWFCG